MRASVLEVAAAVLTTSLVLTYLMRALAVRIGIMDIPNDRSSHELPTPRGGGVAIVVSASAGIGWLMLAGTIEPRVGLALLGGGLLLGAVGIVDDYISLPAGFRFLMHIAAAVWALAWLGKPFHGLAADQHSWVRVAAYLAGLLAIVWTVNLYNFMDGIDGIAGSECVFVCWAGAWLLVVSGGSGSLVAAGVVVGAASMGFLFWNWPPAKIFMGDVGSGYLGYVMAVIAVCAIRDNPPSGWTWLALGGVFIVDSTVTLFRRLARRDRVFSAHRTHAYQRLSRRWGSHLKVTALMIAVDVGWLLFGALFTALYPRAALWIAVATLAPLVIAVIALGAGQPEASAQGVRREWKALTNG